MEFTEVGFAESVRKHMQKVEAVKNSGLAEEATKTSLIMPFFSTVLGYDVFDPNEFAPEYAADPWITEKEKVDYAILSNGKPVILVEAKRIGTQLDKYSPQLYKYFVVASARFAILTNGVVYRFYTDLDEPNKLDKDPFLEVDMTNVKPAQVQELMKFHKSRFDAENIAGRASELKYTNEFQSHFAEELENPSDDFVKFFLKPVYSGKLTQKLTDKFRPVLKKALDDYINEWMNEKITNALNPQPPQLSDGGQIEPEPPEKEEKVPESKITTTIEELGAFFIIKSLLKDVVQVSDISYKDTTGYFGVLYKGKTTKWICRLILNSSRKVLILPDENKEKVSYTLDSIYDLEVYKPQLVEIVKRYL